MRRIVEWETMGQRAEALFGTLKSWNALSDLIGQSESSDFDCKQWSARNAENRGSIAKAACAFANATGGVIIIGMDARSPGSGEPDLVQGFAAVNDTSTVSALVQEIILNGVEPGVQGVQVAEVRERPETMSGCVLVYIPEQEGSPQRTRTDGKFYVRIASGTIQMEYFMLADRFGRRPHPQLTVDTSDLVIHPAYAQDSVNREVTLYVRNEGRGIARFPALHCEKSRGLHYSSGPFGINHSTWAHLDKEERRYSFRGKADDVLYPGETLKIATLYQSGSRVGEPNYDNYARMLPSSKFKFERVILSTQIVCDGMPTRSQTFRWDGIVYEPPVLQ